VEISSQSLVFWPTIQSSQAEPAEWISLTNMNYFPGNPPVAIDASGTRHLYTSFSEQGTYWFNNESRKLIGDNAEFSTTTDFFYLEEGCWVAAFAAVPATSSEVREDVTYQVRLIRNGLIFSEQI